MASKVKVRSPLLSKAYIINPLKIMYAISYYARHLFKIIVTWLPSCYNMLLI